MFKIKFDIRNYYYILNKEILFKGTDILFNYVGLCKINIFKGFYRTIRDGKID